MDIYFLTNDSTNESTNEIIKYCNSECNINNDHINLYKSIDNYL
jgi:hypothetical protein